MKKITLIIFLISVNLPLFGQQQDSFVLHPTYTDQVINEHSFEPIIYEVHQKNLIKYYLADRKTKKITKKNSFVLGGKTSGRVLKGRFKNVGTYVVFKEDCNIFLKSEIVRKDTILKMGISSRHITLDDYSVIIEDVSKQDYYLVTYDFIDRFSFNSSRNRSKNTMHQQSKSSISLTRENTLEYAIEQYKTMILRCKELNAKLLIHSQLAQKGLMSKKRKKAWQRDLTEAKLLSLRVDEFRTKYEKEALHIEDYVHQEMLDNYKDFTETLTSIDGIN